MVSILTCRNLYVWKRILDNEPDYVPNFKTIVEVDFRKDNKEPIKKAFSMICDSLGSIGKEMVNVVSCSV